MTNPYGSLLSSAPDKGIYHGAVDLRGNSKAKPYSLKLKLADVEDRVT